MGRMKLRPVEDQVVAVMGASSGIGRECARRFAGRGARVVAAARDKEALDELVEETTGGGGQAVSQPAEVADPEQVRSLPPLVAEPGDEPAGAHGERVEGHARSTAAGSMGVDRRGYGARTPSRRRTT